MMGYLGMITGILIGHYAENVATWIFALTAGLFMYVALVDMVSNIDKYKPISVIIVVSFHTGLLGPNILV